MMATAGPSSSYDPVSRLRSGFPRDAGLDPDRVRGLERLIDKGIRAGVFPGAVALVARGGAVGWHHAAGDAQIVPDRRPMHLNTIFDLASLTKVMAGLPVALALWERGALDLDAPVRAVVPEFAGAEQATITFRHLLAHTSGLPAWRALYLQAADREGVLAAICTTPLQSLPGTKVEYSDLGILLLGFAIEQITGKRIDALVREIVTSPLALADTMYTPPKDLWERCAATEAGHGYERQMTGREGTGFRWREDVLCGEVHDGNAHYVMQGIAPHAGLFSTASDVASVAFQWLRPGMLVSAEAVGQAIEDQRRGAEGDPRGLGWVLHDDRAFFGVLGTRSFGHTGFTGTSAAIDPDEDLIVVLLTNRVHPDGNNNRIEDFRPQFHAAVRAALRS